MPTYRWWNGNRYTRNSDGYYTRGKGRDWRSLHRDVWEAAHGPIPEGHEVHHRFDNDRDTTDIERLECLTVEEHRRAHEFHERGVRKTWADRRAAGPIRSICGQCGGEALSTGTTAARFCSPVCADAFYRATETGRTYREGTCVICGTIYRVRARSTSETCSRP